jgi:hypothetical protein
MKHLRPSDYKIMPWKNGGGTTTEIAISPEGAALGGEPFHWRLSIADVTSDGSFSTFAGYDRHIMVIDGAGMVLDAGPHGILDLGRPFSPVRFSGDWQVSGRLLSGPVRDFNLMVLRDHGQSELSVQVLRSAETFGSADALVLLHMLDGEALMSGHLIGSGDTLMLSPGERLSVSPFAEEPLLAIGRIRPRSGNPA